MVITTTDLSRFVETFAERIHASRDLLTELDSAIGDADHGINMDRGLTAVVAQLKESPQADAGALFKAAGMKMISTVGGASGPLYGTFFLRLGTSLAGKSEVSTTELAAAIRAGLEGVVARGKAEPGDKTMVDAMGPAVAALESGLDADPTSALTAAAVAAEAGRDATIPLVARKGRASYLGERSANHVDPGATSTAILLDSLRDALTTPQTPG
jgi:dihydroxyacetone kinase-like protein